MKRISKIVLVFLMLLVLLPHDFYGSRLNPAFIYTGSLKFNQDTTRLVNLLVVDTFNLPVIPPSSGVQFFKDRIVFLSLSKNEKKMTPNQISFGAVEAYTATVLDTVTGRHTIFSSQASFSYPCEALTFTPGYDTVYFTGLHKKAKKEMIFLAKFTTNNKGQTILVSDEKPLSFCSDNYSYSHPSLSKDGNFMVFASDMAGTSGGMDLYISKRVGGEWSQPENMGTLINTAGNEFFPFLDSQNNLFFSSDKLPGFGGYDIFTSKFNGKGWDKPVNLSDRINSAKDEIAFTIDKTDGKTAFFTRRNGKVNNEMKLFLITLKKEITFQDPVTISSVFNKFPAEPSNLVAAKTEIPFKPAEVKKPTEQEKLPDEKVTVVKPVTVPAKKEEAMIAEVPAITTKPAEKAVAPKTISQVNPEVNKPDTKVVSKPAIGEQKDIVSYKLQFLPDASQRKSGVVVINGTSYKISEYTYMGAVRYTIGEFSTLQPAVALQRICRQSGYPQSFVVAFKNNSRSLDPNLFK
jgi:hypothetical protein